MVHQLSGLEGMSASSVSSMQNCVAHQHMHSSIHSQELANKQDRLSFGLLQTSWGGAMSLARISAGHVCFAGQLAMTWHCSIWVSSGLTGACPVAEGFAVLTQSLLWQARQQQGETAEQKPRRSCLCLLLARLRMQPTPLCHPHLLGRPCNTCLKQIFNASE